MSAMEDALVVAGLNAFDSLESDGHLPGRGRSTAVRAIIAAVAPLIAAEATRVEQKRCADIAAIAASVWEADAGSCKSQAGERECLAAADAADKITAAIRARTD